MPRKNPTAELQAEEAVVGSPLRRSARISLSSPAPAMIGGRRASQNETTSTPKAVTKSRRLSYNHEIVEPKSEKIEVKAAPRSRRGSMLIEEDQKQIASPSKRASSRTAAPKSESTPAKTRGRRSSVSKQPEQEPEVIEQPEEKPPAGRRRRSVSVKEEDTAEPPKPVRGRRSSVTDKDKSESDVKKPATRSRRSSITPVEEEKPEEIKPKSTRGRRSSITKEEKEEVVEKTPARRGRKPSTDELEEPVVKTIKTPHKSRRSSISENNLETVVEQETESDTANLDSVTLKTSPHNLTPIKKKKPDSNINNINLSIIDETSFTEEPANNSVSENTPQVRSSPRLNKRQSSENVSNSKKITDTTSPIKQEAKEVEEPEEIENVRAKTEIKGNEVNDTVNTSPKIVASTNSSPEKDQDIVANSSDTSSGIGSHDSKQNSPSPAKRKLKMDEDQSDVIHRKSPKISISEEEKELIIVLQELEPAGRLKTESEKKISPVRKSPRLSSRINLSEQTTNERKSPRKSLTNQSMDKEHTSDKSSDTKSPTKPLIENKTVNPYEDDPNISMGSDGSFHFHLNVSVPSSTSQNLSQDNLNEKELEPQNQTDLNDSKGSDKENYPLNTSDTKTNVSSNLKKPLVSTSFNKEIEICTAVVHPKDVNESFSEAMEIDYASEAEVSNCKIDMNVSLAKMSPAKTTPDSETILKDVNKSLNVEQSDSSVSQEAIINVDTDLKLQTSKIDFKENVNTANSKDDETSLDPLVLSEEENEENAPNENSESTKPDNVSKSSGILPNSSPAKIVDCKILDNITVAVPEASVQKNNSVRMDDSKIEVLPTANNEEKNKTVTACHVMEIPDNIKCDKIEDHRIVDQPKSNHLNINSESMVVGNSMNDTEVVISKANLDIQNRKSLSSVSPKQDKELSMKMEMKKPNVGEEKISSTSSESIKNIKEKETSSTPQTLENTSPLKTAKTSPKNDVQSSVAITYADTTEISPNKDTIQKSSPINKKVGNDDREINTTKTMPTQNTEADCGVTTQNQKEDGIDCSDKIDDAQEYSEIDKESKKNVKSRKSLESNNKNHVELDSESKHDKIEGTQEHSKVEKEEKKNVKSRKSLESELDSKSKHNSDEINKTVVDVKENNGTAEMMSTEDQESGRDTQSQIECEVECSDQIEGVQEEHSKSDKDLKKNVKSRKTLESSKKRHVETDSESEHDQSEEMNYKKNKRSRKSVDNSKEMKRNSMSKVTLKTSTTSELSEEENLKSEDSNDKSNVMETEVSDEEDSLSAEDEESSNCSVEFDSDTEENKSTKDESAKMKNSNSSKTINQNKNRKSECTSSKELTTSSDTINKKQKFKSSKDLNNSSDEDSDKSGNESDIEETKEKKTTKSYRLSKLEEFAEAKLYEYLVKKGAELDDSDSEPKLYDCLNSDNLQETDSHDSDYQPEDFIDNMAEEGEEDTPSEGSNDIIDEGESIHSSNCEETDDDSEDDSFICDDDEGELLSGEEYDLSYDTKDKKKKSRIIEVSDSETEFVQLNTSKKSKKPKNKSRIITVTDSSDEDVMSAEEGKKKSVEEESTDDNDYENASFEEEESLQKSSEHNSSQSSPEKIQQTNAEFAKREKMTKKNSKQSDVSVSIGKSKKLNTSKLKSSDYQESSADDYSESESEEETTQESTDENSESSLDILEETRIPTKKEKSTRKKSKQDKNSSKLSNASMSKAKSRKLNASSDLNTSKTKSNLRSSIVIQENIRVDEIKDASLSKRINLLVDSFCTTVRKGEISMNLSLEYADKSSSSSYDQHTEPSSSDLENEVFYKDEESDEPGNRHKSKLVSQRLSVTADDISDYEDPPETVDKPKKRKSKSLEYLDVSSNSLKKKKTHSSLMKKNKLKFGKEKDKTRVTKKNFTSTEDDQEDVSTLNMLDQFINDEKKKLKALKRNKQGSKSSDALSDSTTTERKLSTSVTKNKVLAKPKDFHAKDFKNQMLYDSSRVKRVDTKVLLKKKGY